mgnify:CR=1 FL=1
MPVICYGLRSDFRGEPFPGSAYLLALADDIAQFTTVEQSGPWLLAYLVANLPEERLLPLLPAGGESGTIRNWYKAEEPYVYAKTGTLENNHSLSGFLKTRSGKTLIFSFMNSNYTVSSSEIKKEMEKILLLLRDNF